MKKKAIITTFLIWLCTSCVSITQIRYFIKGSVENMNGNIVYLNDIDNANIIDSTIIVNNSFTFKGCYPKVCFANAVVSDKSIIFILEKGTISLSFDKPIKVNGTKTNDILSACNEKIEIYSDEFRALQKEYFEYSDIQTKEKQEVIDKLDKVRDNQIAVAKECIYHNLNNLVSGYELYRFRDFLSNDEIAKILTISCKEMQETYYAKELFKYLEAIKKSQLGQKFTDFTLKDPNDREVSLSDYIGKGKYVLIDFWASWCGPCRGEMPNVKAAYQKYASKGFEIVGVSLDSKKEDWLKAIKDLCITWPQMSDLKNWECEGAKIYGIRAIPSTLLVDPNGIIIAKNIMGENLEKKLSEVLN